MPLTWPKRSSRHGKGSLTERVRPWGPVTAREDIRSPRAAQIEQKFDFMSDFWYNAPSALHRRTR